MTDKYGLNYQLSIETRSGAFLQLTPPFTLQFDVTRKFFSKANVSSIRILNLSQVNRNQIRKNQWEIDIYRQIALRAGYGKNLPLIHQGNITSAQSFREGVDFISQIESFDGGFALANPNPNPVFPAGTSQAEIIKGLAANLPHISLGAISDFPNNSGLSASYSNPTAEVLATLTGNGFFIDNEVVNCLKTDEVIEDEILILSPQSGLLNTPILEDNFLYIDILFEPRLYIGQQAQLQTGTLGDIGFNYNGPAKVISIHHRGTISEAVTSETVSTVGLDFSAAIYKEVQRETQ